MKNIHDYDLHWDEVSSNDWTAISPEHMDAKTVHHHYRELLRIRVNEALHKLLDHAAKERALEVVDEILTHERLGHKDFVLHDLYKIDRH
jgi:hypothetical protein